MAKEKNGSTVKVIISAIGLILTIAVGVYGYGYLNSQVDTQKTRFNSHYVEDKES